MGVTKEVSPDMIDKLTIGLQWNLPTPQTEFELCAQYETYLS